MPVKTQKLIRVGMLRCDTHAMWYGPLMAEHHPKVLQNPTDPTEVHRYSWQSGGVHMYFYARYGYPLQMSAPFVGGFRIARIWDEDRRSAEMAAKVFCDPPMVCDTPEEASEDVDLVFVADCNEDGRDHYDLASHGLRQGTPVFIDKPLSDSVQGARRIIELARTHGAPVFSASILRTEPALTLFRNRMPEVGTVNFATVNGYGTHPAGLVHTLSAIQHLFGTGLDRIQVMRAANHTSYHVSYGALAGQDSRPLHGVAVHCDVGQRPSTALGLSVYGTLGDIHTTVMGDFVFPNGTARIIHMIRDMVLTGVVPPIMDDMLEAVAGIEAFKQSDRTREPADVASFLAHGSSVRSDSRRSHASCS